MSTYRLTRRGLLRAGAALGAASATGMVAACGDDGQPSGAGGGITGRVTAWSWATDGRPLADLAERYMAEHPQVQVAAETVGADPLFDRAVASLEANAGIADVFQMDFSRLPRFVDGFTDRLVRLDQHGIDPSLFIDSKLTVATGDDGGLYAAPWDAGPAGLFYRADLFEQAGVDVAGLETWSDFLAAAQEVKAATGNNFFSFPITVDSHLSMLVNQQGGSYFDDQGRVALATEPVIQAMTLLKQLGDAGLLNVVSGYSDEIAAIANANICAALRGVWFSFRIEENAPEDQSGAWDVAAIPATDPGGTRAANDGGSYLVVTNEGNVDAAVDFVRASLAEVDSQLFLFETYAEFPSLKAAYQEPSIEAPVPFFGDQPIYARFAGWAEQVPPFIATVDQARAAEAVIAAQAAVLQEGADPAQVLTDAAQRVAEETDRELAT